MQISPEVMHEQVGTIYEQQKAIGYASTFVEGAADCQKYMEGLFDDWQAKGITSVLHEKKGGYANNTASIYGLASKAEAEGVRIMTGVEVKGFEFGNNSARRDGAHDQQGQDRLRLCRRRRRALGQQDSGTCSNCRAPSRSRAATARCMTACACGNTGASRRAPSASIPTCTRPMTARCRRSSMSIPMRRSIPMSTGAAHRQAVGPLLQARLQFRRRAGRRFALQG